MKYTAVVYVYIQNTNEYAGNISQLILRLSRASAAYRGGEEIGPNSTDRGRNGSKIHTLADKNGIPLGFSAQARLQEQIITIQDLFRFY